MIDNFSLGLTHGLMLLAALIFVMRGDRDDAPAKDTPRPSGQWGRKRA